MGNNKVLGVVNLFEIKDNRVYVELDNNLISKLSSKLYALDFDKKFINRMERYKRMPLVSLTGICKKLNISERSIRRNIASITSCKNTRVGIKRPILPFNFRNIHGMRFLSALFGDGSVSEKGGIRYHNQNRTLVNLFLESTRKIFGDIGFKVYFRRDNTYHVSLPKIILYPILILGMEHGYKTAINPEVPKFIFEMEPRAKSAFLRQYFNDEGNVRLKDRRIQVKQTIVTNVKNKKKLRSNIERYSPRFLRGIRILLLDIGIVSKISLSTLREDVSKSDWELSIYGKENIVKFSKFINFDVPYKKNLLLEALNSYVNPSAGRNERLLFALQHAAKIELDKRDLTKAVLSGYCGRSLKTATYFLIDMKKNGFVKIDSLPRDKRGYQLPVEYSITNKGWEFLKKNKERIFIDDVRMLF